MDIQWQLQAGNWNSLFFSFSYYNIDGQCDFCVSDPVQKSLLALSKKSAVMSRCEDIHLEKNRKVSAPLKEFDGSSSAPIETETVGSQDLSFLLKFFFKPQFSTRLEKGDGAPVHMSRLQKNRRNRWTAVSVFTKGNLVLMNQNNNRWGKASNSPREWQVYLGAKCLKVQSQW